MIPHHENKHIPTSPPPPLAGIGNLMPGATKPTTVLGLDIARADKVECSVKN